MNGVIVIQNKIIAVDFDGTLCENKWPEIGEPIQIVIDYVLDQKASGARIILWTNRSDEHLADALSWCENRGIYFDAVNENFPESIEEFGNDSRKIFAHEYLDDKAIHPLIIMMNAASDRIMADENNELAKEVKQKKRKEMRTVSILSIIATCCWALLSVFNAILFFIDGHHWSNLIFGIIFFVLTVVDVWLIVCNTRNGNKKP